MSLVFQIADTESGLSYRNKFWGHTSDHDEPETFGTVQSMRGLSADLKLMSNPSRIKRGNGSRLPPITSADLKLTSLGWTPLNEQSL